MKQCRKCLTDKDKVCFNKQSKTKDGLSPWCKTCHAEQHKIWKQKNRSSESRYEWEYTLNSRYGITVEKYEEMLISQRHMCAICGISQSKLKNLLSVDHCHKTGKVRGLLCSTCNWAIGAFKDDVNVILRAHDYLVFNVGDASAK